MKWTLAMIRTHVNDTTGDQEFYYMFSDHETFGLKKSLGLYESPL